MRRCWILRATASATGSGSPSVLLNCWPTPGPGPGLDLADVGNAFVIEVTGGDADLYLDNIFVSNTCPEAGACNATVNSKDEPAIYSLVWSDEFEGSTLSTDNWGIETGYGGGFGWGNDEWQLYTASPDNVSVQGGNLVLSARCASPRQPVANATAPSPPPGSTP